MENMHSAMDSLVHGSNTLFILMGAILVLAMHAGFAFLEVGTVRHKNQVNALSKILSDFAISALVYFFIGYWIAYGVNFFQPAAALAVDHGYALVKCFFLLTFAAAIPAIISGGIAERARFVPQLCATALIVAFVYLSLRGRGVEWQPGAANLVAGPFRRAFPRFCRVGGGACHGRLAGPCGGAATGRAPWALPRGPVGGVCAVEHSLPGVGLVDSDHRLVRLQRDECPDVAGGERAGSDQLRSWPWSVAPCRPCWPGATTQAFAQRAVGRPGGDLRRLRPDAPDWRTGHRPGGRRVVRRLDPSPQRKTAGRSTTCWACGHCMACAACGVA